MMLGIKLWLYRNDYNKLRSLMHKDYECTCDTCTIIVNRIKQLILEHRHTWEDTGYADVEDCSCGMVRTSDNQTPRVI